MIPLKSPDEIESIRAAGRILRQALKAAGRALRPGISTRELDEIVRETIESAGARPAFKGYRGFPGNSCISVNEMVVHGIPGDRVLAEGDLVSVDVGVVLGGFYADSADTFSVGEVNGPAQRLMDVTRKALAKGVEQCWPDNHLGDISHAIQVQVEANGFSVVRELVGHGIGRELHEEPQIPNFGPPGRGPVLKPGMVLAIEPMVNAGSGEVRTLPDEWTVVTADGQLSAHYEYTVAVTDNGPDILTL
jgi:methionyl aminopeptidase